MEDVHATDHCGFVHEGKVVNGPGSATDFGVHLDEHFGHDGAEVLTFCDGADKDDLGGYGELFEQIALDIVIKGALAFLAGKEENHHLDAVVKLLLQLLDPVVWLHGRLDLAHLGLALVVTTSLQALSHCGLELIANLGITITMEDAPLVEWHLCEHLALDLAIDVTS